MLSYIIWSIVIYCVIRFIFNFVIPVMRTTRHMKQQMRDFQEKVNRQNQYQSTEPERRPGASSARTKAGDYIDFEEVR